MWTNHEPSISTYLRPWTNHHPPFLTTMVTSRCQPAARPPCSQCGFDPNIDISGLDGRSLRAQRHQRFGWWWWIMMVIMVDYVGITECFIGWSWLSMVDELVDGGGQWLLYQVLCYFVLSSAELTQLGQLQHKQKLHDHLGRVISNCHIHTSDGVDWLLRLSTSVWNNHLEV